MSNEYSPRPRAIARLTNLTRLARQKSYQGKQDKENTRQSRLHLHKHKNWG